MLERSLEHIQSIHRDGLKKLDKLDERLADIVKSVKNLPPEPHEVELTNLEIAARVARLSTPALLDLFIEDARIRNFGRSDHRSLQFDGKPYEKSTWGRQARAVRAELDIRIPRRLT